MHETKSIKELLIVYFSGGWGPGSYYFPLLIQLLIIFPLLFILFKKFPIITILLAFGIHLGFDVIRYTLPIPDWSYRLLIFRYFAFIVLGILLYHYKNIMQKKYLLIFLTMLSGIYIWICYYYGYIPVIFSRWTHSSLPTVFWAFGLVVLGFNYLEIKNVIYISKVFSMIGKASYHIFLVQMAYFTFGLGALGLVSNILICIITGIMFYYFETLILNSRHSGFKSFVPPTIQQ
jgi:peptidoglycan/LPS O-acetylase OafA/YrhL